MNDKLKIIGLSGTNGSGKDTIGSILEKNHNYLFISVTDLLRDEAKKRKLPVERENLRSISAEWRRKYGLGVLIDRAVDQYNKSSKKYTGLVMSSIRNPGEVNRIHELGGSIIWVDADPEIRYKRIKSNHFTRGQRAEDDKTFQEFLAEEAAEMTPPTNSDAANLDMYTVRLNSDTTIYNDSSSLEAFAQQVKKALSL